MWGCGLSETREFDTTLRGPQHGVRRSSRGISCGALGTGRASLWRRPIYAAPSTSIASFWGASKQRQTGRLHPWQPDTELVRHAALPGFLLFRFVVHIGQCLKSWEHKPRGAGALGRGRVVITLAALHAQPAGRKGKKAQRGRNTAEHSAFRWIGTICSRVCESRIGRVKID